LIGREANRSAVGARVKVDGQLAEVRSGGSYISHNDMRLFFGLGSAQRIERIEVRWPNGTLETLADLTADQELTILEGIGIIHHSK